MNRKRGEKSPWLECSVSNNSIGCCVHLNGKSKLEKIVEEIENDGDNGSHMESSTTDGRNEHEKIKNGFCCYNCFFPKCQKKKIEKE